MTKPPLKGVTYRAAGVDIEAGDALVERIKPLAKGTARPGVIGGCSSRSGKARRRPPRACAAGSK